MDKKTQIEAETGLTLERIITEEQLDSALNSGLAALYQNVFAEPPYLEKFSIEEVWDCFFGYLREGGYIFIARDPKKESALVAFLVATPLKAHTDWTFPTYADPEKTVYFADAGVDPAYRQRNISVKMKTMLFEIVAEDGFTQGLSRTSQESYKQLSAFNKVGGKIISGVFNDVASKRLDGQVATDRRVFYVYDVAQQKQDAKEADILWPATILRKDGQDIAILPDTTPEKDRQKLEERLKTSYPRIDSILFGQAQGSNPQDVVFTGRLYLTKENKKPRNGPS